MRGAGQRTSGSSRVGWRMLAGILACGLAWPACGGDPRNAGDADVGDDGPAEDVDEADGLDVAETPDAADVPESDDAGPPRPLRALLIDYDVLHPDAWLDLRDALAAADVTLDYRRFYPHVTAADTSGTGAFDIVLLASGLAPDSASAEMALPEVDTAVAFVQAGGMLVLAPWSGYQDTDSADNEWFCFNRILELLDVPVRIEKSQLIGPIFGWDPPLPHQDSDTGYATALEFDVGYAWLRPNPALPTSAGAGDRLAAGRSTTLRTAGGRLEVFATAERGQRLWHHLHGTTMPEQMRSVTDDYPAVLAAEASPGWVAVLPKGFLTVGGANAMVSHQPVLSPEVLTSNRVFLGNVARRLAELRRGASFEPNNPAADQRLFATSAPGAPPLTDSTEVISIAAAPHRHAVPDAPPPGDFLDRAAEPSADAPAVPLFPHGKGTLGFGSVPADPAQVDVRLAEAAAMGLDTLMMTITPEQLVTGDLAPADAEALRARIADVADRATAAGVPWTVGMYYSGYVFANHDADWPWSVGPQNQRLHQPAVACARYWDDALTPAVVEVATIAADHPGIAGIEIDAELYGGALWYTDLQSFDDESFQVYLDGITDDALRAELAALGLRQRLDALIDRGLLRDYFAALSAHVEAAARRMETAVHALDPGFTFVIYAPIFSSGWFYRAVGRGLATPALPVVWLSYDTLTARQRAGWVGDGIPSVHLAGMILGNFAPAELQLGLEHGLTEADGFWFFSSDELSDTATDDPRHGTRAEYRAAVTAAAAAR